MKNSYPDKEHPLGDRGICVNQRWTDQSAREWNGPILSLISHDRWPADQSDISDSMPVKVTHMMVQSHTTACERLKFMLLIHTAVLVLCSPAQSHTKPLHSLLLSTQLRVYPAPLKPHLLTQKMKEIKTKNKIILGRAWKCFRLVVWNWRGTQGDTSSFLKKQKRSVLCPKSTGSHSIHMLYRAHTVTQTVTSRGSCPGCRVDPVCNSRTAGPQNCCDP